MVFNNPEKRLNFAIVCFLCILSSLILFLGLNGSLRDWDESVYAQVAKENLENRDWYNLYWNKGIWIDKPPLMIWVTRLVYESFGVGEWQARIGSAFAGFILVFITYFWVKKLLGVYAGCLSALILLGTPHFIRIAKMGQLDVPVAMFSTVSLYFFFLAVREKKNYFFLLSGVAVGLALMTKWVVGLFPVFVQCALFFFPDYRKVVKNKYWWLGNFLAIVVIAPWFIQQYLQFHNFFLGHFIGMKLLGSIGSEIAGHGGGIFYYIDIMISKSRPWIFVFIPIFFVLVYKTIRKDRISIFLFVWFCVVFFLFSFSKTKLHWYIMPVYPSFAFIITYILTDFIRSNKYRGILVCAAVFVIVGHVFFTREYIKLDLNKEMKEFLNIAGDSLKKEDVLYVYKGTFSPSLLFYTGKKVVLINDDEDFNSELNNDYEITVISDYKNCDYIVNLIDAKKFDMIKPPLNSKKYNAFFIKINNKG